MQRINLQVQETQGGGVGVEHLRQGRVGAGEGSSQATGLGLNTEAVLEALGEWLIFSP